MTKRNLKLPETDPNGGPSQGRSAQIGVPHNIVAGRAATNIQAAATPPQPSQVTAPTAPPAAKPPRPAPPAAIHPRVPELPAPTAPAAAIPPRVAEVPAPTAPVVAKPPRAARVVAPTATAAAKPPRSARGPAPNVPAAAKPIRTAVAKPPPKRRKVQSLGRNRASPARLVKLNRLLTPEQKKLVASWDWGGLVNMKASEMPVDLSMWVLSCFDPIRSELAVPGRGSIPVTAESFERNFGIKNEGRPVCYEMDQNAIRFMNSEYGLQSGSSPEWSDWCTMIVNMNGATDMKFLRAYFAAALSSFLCPTTKCSISPRCYGTVMDLNQFKKTNFAQWAIAEIVNAVKQMGVKKQSVCCCLYHLVLTYVDALEHDESVPSIEECPIRAEAWTDKLIQAVMQKDMKPNGEFGKLRLKDGVGATIRDSLFVGMSRTEDFVSSKLPRDYPNKKKRKIVVMFGELCTDISNRLGHIVEQIGMMDEQDCRNNVAHRRKKRPRTDAEGGDVDDEDEDAPYIADSDSDTDDSSGDDDEEDDGNNGIPEVNRTNHRNEPDNEEQEFHDKESGSVISPRRSARLSKNCSNQCSYMDDDEHVPDASTMMTAVQNSDDVTHTSPAHVFSELRKYVGEVSEGDIVLPHNEPDGKLNVTGRSYANSVFLEEVARENRRTPASTPAVDQFRRDPAINKLQAECAAIEKLQIRDEKEVKKVLNQKIAFNRGRPEKIVNLGVTEEQECTEPKSVAQCATHDQPAATHDQVRCQTTPTTCNSNLPETQQVSTSTTQARTRLLSPVTPTNKKGMQSNLVSQHSTAPTRKSCPPPLPKTHVSPRRNFSAEVFGEGYCPAPSFDLGFDSPKKNTQEMLETAAAPPPSTGITPVNLNSDRFNDDDVWSPEMIKEAFDVCERVEMEKGYGKCKKAVEGEEEQTNNKFKTPAKPNTAVDSITNGSDSKSVTPVEQLQERRIVRQAACRRSPYVTYEIKSLYTPTSDVNKLYELLTSHGRRSTRAKEADNSPILVSYEKYFVSLKELANSMMPAGWLDNIVMELGIESIMMRKEKKIKKVVMPLRVATLLQDMEWKNNEIKKYFSKASAHLDRKECFMLPVQENLAPGAPHPVNHYWLFVVNIRDRRYEVLDSMRSISDKNLDATVKKIVACITLV